MASRALEMWFRTGSPDLPDVAIRAAQQAEAEGWDGFSVGDNQNVMPDPYALLNAIAVETSRILLGTGVTNPVTRHPAVMATAIATVQAGSGGRAVLGIGRGDSSLAHLGLAPAPLPMFSRYLERLQGYLRGDEVPFDLEADARDGIAAASSLHLADTPTTSRLRWLPPELPKVPVQVSASGPKVIAMAGRLADGITLAVGTDPARLRWAIDLARDARREAGLDPDSLSIGAFVPIMVHPDRARARTLVAGGTTSFARFSVMHGTIVGPTTDQQRQDLELLHTAYDMNRHGTAQSAITLSDELVDAFAVAGPPSYCVERLTEMGELGLDRIIVLSGGPGQDPREVAQHRELFTGQVLPALR